ncbi:helix-turn-helix transcriptional regulator [Pseudonocardia zijingensis]|uniref:helix-turn-helix transcriptional regulator n=1 Tax=Pseudonocardia zijingensis TaxID=153376 RepID=UPI0031E13DCD
MTTASSTLQHRSTDNIPLRLYGRTAECARVEQLLQLERATLRIIGESGIGKSTLLEHAARRATGYRLLRVRGVAAEHELPYAGLHLLCAPLIDDLHALQPAQRDALATAIGLTPGPPPDRPLVSLAVLNLLTRAADTRPVCCIVDDAHLLDPASRLVLAFVARRAERGLLILLAEREHQHGTELDGVPELRLEPLPYDDARFLLAATTPGKVDAAVIERVLIEARGNPGTLVDAFDGITAVELAGGYAIPAPRAAHPEPDHGCAQRSRQLRADARRLLLTAAADPTGDPPVAWRAAATLGIGTDAAEVLESQRLLVFGPRIAFACPRLRATVYATAAPAELREIHGALADAVDADVDADRRAWHRALGCSGLDDAVATDLERHAPTAHTRGGIAARAAFLEKAALLTPDPVRRAQRALTAAEAHQLSGAPEIAQRLLAIAEIAPPDDARRARMALQRARIAFTTHRSPASPGHLLEAARRIEPHSPALARDAYLEALTAALFAGELATNPTAVDVAGAARAAVAAGPAHPADPLLDALATRVLDGPLTAAGPLAAVLGAFRAPELDPAVSRWLWLAGCIAADSWDAQAWTALSSRQEAHACAENTATPAHVQAHLALADVYLGRFDAARGRLARVDAKVSTTRTTPLRHPALLLAAWQGRPGVLHDLVANARRDARDRGDGVTSAAADLAEAIMHNSVGRYQQALAAASDACRSEQLAFAGWALPELVEAAVRSGRHDAARRAVTRLTERTDAAGTDWGLGVQAAARALLADEQGAEPLYREAIDRLARTGIRTHFGRVQLLYGEWLRRRKRRVDARIPLRAAFELFTTIGSDALADRAHRELLATGEKARRRSVDAGRQLTPQEARIAHLALNGLSNPEIGARLFVSPRTVEYHLHKVFAKLGISSRTELHMVLATAANTHPLGRSDAPAGETTGHRTRGSTEPTDA